MRIEQPLGHAGGGCQEVAFETWEGKALPTLHLPVREGSWDPVSLL